MISKDDKEFEGYTGTFKPLTSAQLMVMYGISRGTWYAWMKEMKTVLGPRNGWTFNVRQVRLIIRRFGPPPYDEMGNEVVI